MSESKTPCPQCNRPPGGIHADPCPRSRASRQQLADELERAGRPRIFWMKGPIMVRKPGARRPKIIHNPGVPYVKPPKHWRAGGVPRDASAVEEFLRQLGVDA